MNKIVRELEKKLSKKTALLVIDVQNDYCSPSGALAKSGKPMQCIQEAAEKTIAVVEQAREARVPIVFTRMDYDLEKIPANNLERLKINKMEGLCAPGSWGAAFYKVRPKKGDRVVTKNFYDAFFRTDLGKWLEKKDVQTILLCGVVTNICPLLTAAEAYYRGYDLVAVNDCLGAYEDQESALHYMRQQFAATVACSNEVIGVLKAVKQNT
ncbi:MAG: isochorismatase family cysteine hydrolase [Candidatus Micrarchaeota archaeon]